MVVLAMLLQPLSGALATGPGAAGTGSLPTGNLPALPAHSQTGANQPWVRPEIAPQTFGEVKLPDTQALAAGQPNTPDVPIPGMFPYGNNNFGQTYKDTNNPEEHPGKHFAGPVNLLNGNLHLAVGDLFFFAAGLPVQFARYYNHQDSATGPFGVGWTHSYNAQIVSDDVFTTLIIRNGDGSLHEYSSFDGGMTWEPPPGIFRELIRSPGDPFAPVVVRHKNGLTEQFIPQLLGGHLEFIQDRNGNSVVLGYDMDERLATISDSTGARQLVINYSLTVPSLIESVVDPTGREVTYEYDASNQLATVYYPEGSTATYTYDVSNRLDSYDDPRMPRGQAHLDVQYDGSNRAAHVEYTIDSFFDITYEVGGLAYTQWLDSEGSLHQVEYDPNFFNIVHDDTWISELGMWIGEAYSYYPDHMLQAKLDALGRLTVYDYDNWGNLVSIVDPMLAQTTFGYDPLFSNVISTTNPAGDMIQYFYDGNGNLTDELAPLGRTATYTYDPVGNLLSQQDALGNLTQFTYDANGNLLTIANSDGYTTTFTYDPIGRVETKEGPDTAITQFEYDAADRLVRVTDPLSETIEYVYDDRDNLLYLTDANGSTITHTYNTLDQLTSITDPLSNTTSYEYDTLGRMTRRLDATGSDTLYTYDETSRMIERLYGDGQLDVFHYDLVGNITYMEGNNTITLIAYDDANRPIQYLFDAPGIFSSPTYVSYTYGLMGNMTSALIDDGALTWETTYSYDPLNRLVQTTDNNGRVWATAYDQADRRISLTNPDTSHVEYDYDARGNLTQTVHYDPANNPVHTYAYDYDGLNNLTTEDADGVAFTYSYDPLNRLVSALTPGGSIGYSYDPVGNRISETDANGHTTNYSYDPAGHLIGTNDTVYNYDLMGRRTDDSGAAGARTYDYDGEMRLTHYYHIDSFFDVSLEYDPLSRLVRISDSDGNDRFLLHGDNRLEAELDPAGNLIRAYTIDTEIIAMDLVGGAPLTVDYHWDGRGQVRWVTDAATGDILAEYNGGATENHATFYNPIRVGGMYFIPEIGFYHVGDGLFLDPEAGVFLFRYWPWVFWPFHPYHPWIPLFHYWPWAWPWPRPWGWAWPRPWAFLWPWPGVWVRPFLIWPMWPWPFQPWLPWWWWGDWWGWFPWGHWWWWHPWWWYDHWWSWGWWFWGWWGWEWWLWQWWWPWYWWMPCWWIWGWWWWWHPWWGIPWWRWRWRWHWWRPWWHWHWWWWGWPSPPPLVLPRPPDYGDAPDPAYPSLLASNGARHLRSYHEWLGPTVDQEFNAEIIDLDAYDDGVQVDLANSVINFTVNTSGNYWRYGPTAPVHVHGWMDWNGDGDWNDPGEFVLNWSGYPGGGGWPLVPSVSVAAPLSVPPGALPGSIWARFRLDYAQNIETVTGPARYGEVEDYVLYTQPLTPAWDGATDVSLVDPLVIAYPVDMVTSTVSVQLTPTVPITLAWSTTPLENITANTLTIHHAPFASYTQYQVGVSGGQTVNGHWMQSAVYSFTTEPAYGVTLSGDMAASGDPGTTVMYTVNITNTGDMLDTFDLAAAGNLWTTGLSTSTITLGAGANASFQVNVSIPAEAAGGSSDIAAISATSQGDAQQSDTANLTTTANNIYGVALSPDDALSGLAGTTVTYTMQITNTGNVQDTFSLAASGNAWPTTIATPSVILAAGASTTVQVEVNIPGSATDGETDSTLITATSQGDPAATDSATLTTTAVVSAVYGVELSPDDALSGLAGTTVTYTMQITNTGNVQDTFSLTASGNAWPTTIATPNVILAAGASATVQVEVDIPGSATDGEKDTAAITATSQGDPAATDSATLTTTAVVSAVYGVELSPDDATTGLAGTTVTYTGQITNTGNVQDTFSLAASGNAWPTTIATPSVILASGASATVQVEVDIPGSATDGETDNALITATSQGDPAATDSATLTTTAVVSAVYGVELSLNDAASGEAGTIVVYSVFLTNTGNLPDTFDLAASGNTWTATLSIPNITLNPGESASIIVEVHIPGDANAGDADVVMLTATSRSDPTATASATLTTTAAVTQHEIYLPIVIR